MPDNKAAKGSNFPQRLAFKTPMLKECCILAESWLKDCVENHSCFNIAEVPLPTRVIHCGTSDGAQLLRLLVTEDRRGSYVALSHCWGSKPTLVTTQDQLDSFQTGIPWSTIPRSFQDAITVTRTLGLQYLWIDTLCIIQGSQQDWLWESAKMGDVYQNAWLTIAASSAPDNHAGFLDDRNSKFVTPLIELPHGNDGSLFLRHHIGGWKETVGDSLLNQRGWALQERMLSPRILYFTAEQIQWEYRKLTACEAGSKPAEDASPLKLKTAHEVAIRIPVLEIRRRGNIAHSGMGNNSFRIL
jgi:Heterokaryon incompatibility protein (HET)